jgi:Flp pilus assembly protein TadB
VEEARYKAASIFGCLLISFTYKREKERDRKRERREKMTREKNLASMRHTKVHPLRSKRRRDAQSRLTGLRRYRMPLSHVFVLRQFEDTRESNYGHPSFALASILRTLHRLDVPSGQFARTVLFFGVVGSFTRLFCEPSQSSCLVASGLE